MCIRRNFSFNHSLIHSTLDEIFKRKLQSIHLSVYIIFEKIEKVTRDVSKDIKVILLGANNFLKKWRLVWRNVWLAVLSILLPFFGLFSSKSPLFYPQCLIRISTLCSPKKGRTISYFPSCLHFVFVTTCILYLYVITNCTHLF